MPVLLSRLAAVPAQVSFDIEFVEASLAKFSGRNIVLEGLVAIDRTIDMPPATVIAMWATGQKGSGDVFMMTPVVVPFLANTPSEFFAEK